MEVKNQKIKTFLMFSGNAEEAMKYYVSIFDHSEIVNIKRYGVKEAGKEGTVELATFTLNNQEFMCIDSNIEHGFTFTPAISLYVTCDTEEEINRLYEKLSEGGQILMPLDTYPFSTKFVWVADKFGVSWQLSYQS